jgi:hypothetical protein
LPRVVAYLLALVAGGAALVAWATVVVTWPVGRLIGSWAILRDVDVTSFVLSERHWVPGVAILLLAAVLLAASPIWARSFKVAMAAAGLGVGLLVLLWGFPWAILEGRRVFEVEKILNPAAIGGTSATAALIGYALKAAIRPLQKALARLGGVLLAFIVFLFAGKVATDAAVGGGLFSGWQLWVGLAIGFGLFFALVDIQRLSLREVYRSRLQGAFTFRRTPDGQKVALPTDQQETWTDLPSDPELIVCATVHHSGLVRRGTAADSFTISRTEVRQGTAGVPTAVYLDQLPRSTGHMKYVASWMAVTGAAFSSAMGIYSLGTTNALMAALNVDLGIWLPNVAKVAADYHSFPWIRLGYLVKEVFGIYDEQDDYVFVADGGQWENLGLVELLRRRCTTILCIDASNDEPGSYSTLRAAVALAADELDDDIEVDLSGLDGSSDLGGVGRSVVTRLPFTLVPKGREEEPPAGGVIYFAKLQLADDLPKHVRRFARIDPDFPSYSTANQLLDDQQFSYLVEAGRWAGEALSEAYRFDSGEAT